MSRRSGKTVIVHNCFSTRTWIGLTAAAAAVFYALVLGMLVAAEQAHVQFYWGGWGADQVAAVAALLVVGGVLVTAGCFVPPLVNRISRRLLREVVGDVLAGTYLIAGCFAMGVAVFFATVTGVTPYQVYDSPAGDQHVLLTQRGFGDGDMSQHLWGPIYQTRAQYGYDFPQAPIWNTAVVEWMPDTFAITYRFGPRSPSLTTATMPLSTH